MKNKHITAISNLTILVIIATTAFVSFNGIKTVSAPTDDPIVYYRSKGESDGVSLMFNVYQYTENVYKILNILDDHQAKATFFLGGCWAEKNTDCAKEISVRGHEIASHGYFHRDHKTLSYQQNVEEISASVQLLSHLSNQPVTLFAPPSGSYDSQTVSACRSLGLKTILWTKDTIDWRDDDVDLIVSRATQNLETGEYILLHPMDVTVKALPKILSYIREKEYKTLPISLNTGE